MNLQTVAAPKYKRLERANEGGPSGVTEFARAPRAQIPLHFKATMQGFEFSADGATLLTEAGKGEFERLLATELAAVFKACGVRDTGDNRRMVAAVLFRATTARAKMTPPLQLPADTPIGLVAGIHVAMDEQQFIAAYAIAAAAAGALLAALAVADPAPTSGAP